LLYLTGRFNLGLRLVRYLLQQEPSAMPMKIREQFVGKGFD
jgi:hypothetical protein